VSGELAHFRFSRDMAFIPVCRDCGREIRHGEPRAIVRQRFVICVNCLYSQAKRLSVRQESLGDCDPGK